MTKKFSIFLTVLFCAFIGGVCVISLLLPDKDFSPLENRSLQKPPKLSLETLGSGKFMEDAEDYVSDHIAGRDFWVAAKAWSERLSGKQENEGVYFGTQNTLIPRVEEPDMDKLEKDIGYVDTLVGNLSVPVYLGLIPSAAEIWRDRLPKGAPTADEKSAIDRLYFATGAETVDLYSALDAHRQEDIYYRTDHHWTSLGAFYGANAILEAMGMEPLELLQEVLADFELEVLETTPIEYRCYCSRERVSRALISMGKKDLTELIAEQGQAELTCQFCDQVYRFSREELETLLAEM